MVGVVGSAVVRLKAVAGKRRCEELRHRCDGLATVSELEPSVLEAIEKPPVVL